MCADSCSKPVFVFGGRGNTRWTADAQLAPSLLRFDASRDASGDRGPFEISHVPVWAKNYFGNLLGWWIRSDGCYCELWPDLARFLLCRRFDWSEKFEALFSVFFRHCYARWINLRFGLWIYLWQRYTRNFWRRWYCKNIPTGNWFVFRGIPININIHQHTPPTLNKIYI